MKDKQSSGNPFFIILIAVIVVMVVSFLPLSKVSGGKLSDFNLFSDLIQQNDSADDTYEMNSSMPVDPMLLSVIEEADEVSAQSITNNLDDTPDYIEDSVPVIPESKISFRDSLGVVDIEDYSIGENGLKNLKKSLDEGSFARIAIVGDSYIEGDIFTQDLRSLLQSEYGGSGVGYVNMYSEFPGFRQSVRQSGSGWTDHKAGKKGTRSKYIGLAESYFTAQGNAYSLYKGSKTIPHVDSWTESKFLCIAPYGGTVTLKADETNEVFVLSPSTDVQCVSLSVPTTDFKVSVSDSSLVALGVWLDSNTGIGLDCMSTRGFSGVSLGNIDLELCRHMSEFIDYDLIILQFGLNAMSAGQKNYSVYSDRIVSVITHLRECYPDADFLIMGVGDRGERRNGEIHSMAAVESMIEYQREAARKARCLFWDTREAMGGVDAIAEWTRAGLTNKDYIHMTHKGGARLAGCFYESLNRLLK